MEVPTLEMVRLRSALLRSRFVSPGADAELTALRDDAVGIVSLATGRIIGGVTGTGMFGCPLEEVPANLEPVLLRSIVKKIEQIAIADEEETRESQVENQEGGLASFTAGPYCVPLDTLALTKRGWLRYDEIRVGDLVMGYDAAAGVSRWTPVLEVIEPVEAPLVRVGNQRWSFRCTPNHRWVTRRRWMEDGEYLAGDWELEEAMDLVGSRRWDLLTAASAETPIELPISPAEAAVVAWLWTDGHMERVLTETRDSIRGRITQKNHRDVLETALVGAGTSYTVTPYKDRPGQVKYNLPARWLRDLWERAELDSLSPSEFILRLGTEQREAFLEAGIWAEGTNTPTDRGVRRLDGQGPWYRHGISQMPGPKRDAFQLAAFLCGYEPSLPKREDSCSGVRLNGNYHSGQTVKIEEAGSELVWCVRTGLGTWTIKQGDRIALTGNSESYFQPGSGSSSSGSLVIDSDPATNSGLVLAMTECMRAGWLHQADPVNFPYPPACAVTAYDWFPEGSLRPWGYGGPDGF